MHIHVHFGKRIEDGFSQIHINGHGILRIIFSGSSGIDLKGLVFVGIYTVQKGNDILAKLFKAFILHVNNRTDGRNTEYTLQMLHRVLKVKIRHGIHINSALGLSYLKFSVTFFQGIFNLVCQRIFK